MRRAVAVALLVAGLASACSDDPEPGDLIGKVVDPPFTVADQELVDTDGEPFSLTDDTDARLTLVFFGYTNCPDVCQLVLGNLASTMQQLEDDAREQVQVVFVTTDPARDTAEVIRDYLDDFDPQFVGLRGEIGEIEQVAASVGVGLGDKLPSGAYEVDAHTTTVTAVDVAGEAPVYWNQTTSPGEYVDDIHALLEED